MIGRKKSAARKTVASGGWRHLPVQVRNGIRSFCGDETGVIAILTGILLPVFVGFTALGIDAAEFLRFRHTLQQNADAAAVSGAWALTRGAAAAQIESAAEREASRDGYNGEGTFDASLLAADDDAWGSTWQPVQVSIEAPLDLYFAGLFMPGGGKASVRAIAVVNMRDEYCVLALDPNEDDAINVIGTANAAFGCGVASNSMSPSAINASGDAVLEAEPVGSVGGIEQTGSSEIITETTLREYAPPVPDPYTDLEVPEFNGCDQNNFRAQVSQTIGPGVYCGGINVNAGATLSLDPGVYILDRGDLSMGGNAAVEGDGVTIVFTSSTGSNIGGLDITGGADIRLTAPTDDDDPYEGILFFQDPDADPNPGGLGNRLLGGSSSRFDGLIYFPNQPVTLTGGAGVSGCTRLVARTIEFNGNAEIGSQCADFGLEPLGNLFVRLAG